MALALLLPGALAAAEQGARVAPAVASSSEPGFLPAGTNEWALGVAAAEPVSVAGSLNERNSAFLMVQWGRVLFRPRGPSPVRGQLMMGVEVEPIHTIYQTETTYGVGFSPIFFRWQMKAIGRVAPYTEILGGALYTSHRVPEGVSAFNYTAEAGVGVRVGLNEHRAMLFSYRLHHISNGGLGPRSRSLNSNVISAGIAFR
ncbi:MAG: hypothetical protein A3G77_01470 [Acidobacteria bacterium RIFCSPLOWO2_12_FULL_68_19]|nr:MAG: hypothetical protein A3G77_01470 [Acidobacteria bacterium RIFCSPLOWO2_12_FULL_68_19]